jgi:hypothetical protein
MARGLTKRPLTRAEMWDYQVLVLGKDTPRESHLSRRCVEALLTRRSIKSATERTWLKERFQNLAGIENLFHSMLPDSQAACKGFFEEIYQARLAVIERGRAPRKLRKHNPEALRMQRRLLIDVLDPNYRTYPDEQREKWLYDNWNDLMARLQPVPCRCSYDHINNLTKPPDESILDDLSTYSTPGELIPAILGKLHGIPSDEGVLALLNS